MRETANWGHFVIVRGQNEGIMWWTIGRVKVLGECQKAHAGVILVCEFALSVLCECGKSKWVHFLRIRGHIRAFYQWQCLYLGYYMSAWGHTEDIMWVWSYWGNYVSEVTEYNMWGSEVTVRILCQCQSPSCWGGSVSRKRGYFVFFKSLWWFYIRSSSTVICECQR